MNKLILVVDDEPILREILKECFEEAHFSVIEAENAVQAIVLIKTKQIDFVVSDIRMPGGSGIDLAESLFNMPEPKPSLILMTGYSDFSPEQAHNLNVVKIFSKPFEPEDIIKEIQARLRV